MTTWFSFAAGLALKSSALLAMAWLVSWAMRRQSAAARHLVWLTTWVMLLGLPAFSLLLPAVPWSWTASLIVPNITVQAVLGVSAMPSTSGVVSLPSARPVPPQRLFFHWRESLLAVWAAGTLLALVQFAAAWFAMVRLRRSCSPLDLPELGSLRKTLGIAFPVDVLASKPGTMPMVLGLLKPTILLPEDAVEWSAERRRVVLLHELAHVRRSDLLAQLIPRTALALHWWNPLAWSAWAVFLRERERATDDLVLQAGSAAPDYAGHLLQIAEAMQAPAVALAMVRRSQLEDRLTAILNPRINRSTPGRASTWLAAGVAVALLLPMAAVRAQDPMDVAVPADLEATIRIASSEGRFAALDKIAARAAGQRNFDTARKLLDASLQIRENVSGTRSIEYGVGLVNLGDLERRRANKSEAEAFYAKAAGVLTGRPESAPALIHLGVAALTAKNQNQALDYFDRARAADPKSAMALMWKALVRERQKNFEEANSLFEQAISLVAPNSSDSATLMDVYARFLQSRGRIDDANSLRQNAAVTRKFSSGARTAAAPKVAPGSYRIGTGISPPSLITKVEPDYSEEARQAQYQGTVVLSVIIGTDGKVYSNTVERSLGLGLDEKAIEAIYQWVFKPGMKDGQPVNVMATIEVNFRLK